MGFVVGYLSHIMLNPFEDDLVYLAGRNRSDDGYHFAHPHPG